MPATHSKRGKGSADYARKIRMPEPPPKPKTQQYFILGMEVDYNTYREYMYEREYRIDGDILKDILCSIGTLERYATEEHAREYPIEAAAAHMILDQIREEIIATMNRKEEQNMKELKTSADFIAALSDIYCDSRKAYEALQERSDKAKTKMEAAEMEMKSPDCQDRSMAEALFNVAKAEYQLAESTRIREYREMHSGHGIKVAELREKFNDFLSELYSANPDSLDTATMQLLEYGIVKASDMVRLAERHKANPTMLRILGEHARKMRDSRKISYEDRDQLAVVIQKALAAADGSREQAIFDSAVNSMEYGLGNDYKHASRMHAYVVGWLDNFREQMETVFDNSAAANGGEGE